MTTTFDASPLSTVPANLPALPTGTFALAISTPSVAPDSCLSVAAQSNAWSCNIAPALPYQIEIYDLMASPETADTEAMLNYGNVTMDFLPYGAQPPIIDEAHVMRLVNDSEYPERGPAWFFQTSYNKLVVLHETDLSASSSTSRREVEQRAQPVGAFLGQKSVAQPGDKPWFCYWNGTLLESFIYVNETSKAGAAAALLATATTSSSAATQTAAQYPGATADPQFLACLPKVMKMEERRVPYGDSISPYCVQHTINGDGTYTPYTNGGNTPVTIYLNETIPQTVTSMGAKRDLLAAFDERTSMPLEERQTNAQCGCVWLAQ